MISIHRMKYFVPILAITFIEVSHRSAEGILSLSDKIKNSSDVVGSDVLIVPVNATKEDLLQISSRIRFENIL